MITQLTIKNYALIDSLDMEFHKGFSVITGETGAGKSIILGAIALLLGQRADSKTVKSGESRCIIEAHFDLSRYNMEDFFTENDIDYDTSDTILRRELTSAGKSRAFINDTPVGLSVMRQLGQQLVDIHSQHQNLLLQEEDFQLNVVDVIANNHELLQQYKAKYNELHAAERELESLKQALQKASNDEDFLRFQLQELQDANLEEGMQEELEQEAEMLSHAEEIKSALYEADTLLTGSEQCIVDQLKNALRPLSRITDVYPKIAEAVERLESAHVEIKDIAQEIGSAASQVDYDPQRLEIVNSALDTIYSLQKKHHVESVDELIALRDNMEKQLQQIENSDEALAEQEQTVKRLLDEALQLANKLSATRKKAAAEAAARENARRIAEAKAKEEKAKAEARAAAAKKNAEAKAAAERAAREAEQARQAAERKAKADAEARKKELAEAKKREAAEKRKLEAEAKKRASESKAEYTVSAVDRQMSGNFESNRGRLPFPVTGSYRIMNRFGTNTVTDVKGHVTLDKKGIDIKGQPGANVRCIFDGEVSAVFSYSGTTVIIVRHGSYLSVYCDLASVSVSRGQKVSARPTLGRLGSEGVMQFQLRKGNALLNPEAWLSR